MKVNSRPGVDYVDVSKALESVNSVIVIISGIQTVLKLLANWWTWNYLKLVGGIVDLKLFET